MVYRPYEFVYLPKSSRHQNWCHAPLSRMYVCVCVRARGAGGTYEKQGLKECSTGQEGVNCKGQPYSGGLRGVACMCDQGRRTPPRWQSIGGNSTGCDCRHKSLSIQTTRPNFFRTSSVPRICWCSQAVVHCCGKWYQRRGGHRDHMLAPHIDLES